MMAHDDGDTDCGAPSYSRPDVAWKVETVRLVSRTTLNSIGVLHGSNSGVIYDTVRRD